MGTWSHQSFGNDDALDWCCELEGESDFGFVERTLQKVIDTGSQYLDSCSASEAIAACEVIARALGHYGERDAYSESADNWVQEHELNPKIALLKNALIVLDRVVAEPSELRDVWHDSGELQEWVSAIDDLKMRLGTKREVVRKLKPNAQPKKVSWRTLQKGDLFEIRTHSGKSLMAQVVASGNLLHVCVLDCTGEEYQASTEVIRSAKALFEAQATDEEFSRGNWVLRGHTEARTFFRPYHVVNTAEGFVLRDFDCVVVRLATPADEALYGYRSSYSGSALTRAVSMYFNDGLDAAYGKLDVRWLQKASQLT
jgi:hypothetical protein